MERVIALMLNLVVLDHRARPGHDFGHRVRKVNL
jgi:hypothetical protein